MTRGLEARLLRIEKALEPRVSAEEMAALDAALIRDTAEILRKYGGDEAAVLKILTETMEAPDLGVDREQAEAYATELLESARSVGRLSPDS